MKVRTKNFSFFILGVLFSLNILAWIAVYNLSKPQLLVVNFFDVGQGDAIFITSPQRHQILIDGGPGPAILEKLATEMPFYDRSLDLIVLTHPEHDHIAGLIEVLKRYKVDYILWTGIIRNTSEYEEWLKTIAQENAQIKIAKAGQRIIASRMVLDILYPFENLEDKKVKNTNNTSIISHLIFGNNSFLFTGDAYKSVEKKLIESKTNIDSDVLKVGHHGSKTSSAKDFIEKVSPAIAVIQCGKNNPYGHPRPETLETLAKYDIKILRTDLDGDIKIISDGTKIKIK